MKKCKKKIIDRMHVLTMKNRVDACYQFSISHDNKLLSSIFFIFRPLSSLLPSSFSLVLFPSALFPQCLSFSFSILLRLSLLHLFLSLTLIIASPKPVRFILGRSAKREVACGPARCRSSGILVIVGASLSGPR